MVAASSLIAIYGAQDLAIYSDPDDTIWMNEMVTYTNFAYNVVRLDPEGNTDWAQEKTFLAHGNGDLISTLYLEILRPAIIPNGGGSSSYAYYVNSFGWAAIDRIQLRVGTQDSITIHGRWVEALIELTLAPGSRYEELVGTFDTEAELIQHAKGDTQILVPILLPQTRYLHNALPIISLHHSTVKYVIRLFDLSLLVVNSGDATVKPWKYGTTAEVQNSDFVIRMFMTNIFLDECERALFLCSDLKYVITQTQEFTQQVSQTSGTINFQGISINHPVRYALLFLQRVQSIDGTTKTIDSVGLKDRFDYCADHGGESMYNIKWEVNNQPIWDDKISSKFLRKIKTRESFPRCTNRNIYCWAFGPNCDHWNLVQTVNFSRIDTTKVSFSNNNAAYTVGDMAYCYIENGNVFVVYGGTGGTPFTS